MWRILLSKVNQLFLRIGHFDHITNGTIQKKKYYQLFPVLQIVDQPPILTIEI